MIWLPAPIPPNGLLLKMPYRFNRSHQLLVRNRLCALVDSFILQDLHKEPAMNGTSGFQEVRSSTSRSSTNRLLCRQRPLFGTGAWHLSQTHDLIALSTGISMKRENARCVLLLIDSRSDEI